MDPDCPSLPACGQDGNTNNAGPKGLAFLNAVTGVYDATIFKANNGGNPTMDFTATEHTPAGVDMSAGASLSTLCVPVSTGRHPLNIHCRKYGADCRKSIPFHACDPGGGR